MNLSEHVSIPTQVMARQVGDETVILDLVSGTYFGLYPVGARVWQLIGEGKSLGEICETLFGEYAVTREDLERDVIKLVSELLSQGLVRQGRS